MKTRANPMRVLGFVLLLPMVVGCAEDREPIVLEFDTAIEDLIAEGFPEAIETQLNSLGTSELGYRLGGTSANNAAAAFLAEQMRAMGLSRVRLEPVPLDVWEVQGASVTVDGRTTTCSQFPGVPPTPAEGITAEVVYVEAGAAANYEGKSVEGKIVLVDLMLDSWWLNLPAHEATVRGAAAVIFTTSPEDSSYYSFAPDALGSNDALYGSEWVPAVYLARRDGDWLKAELARRPVTATLQNAVEVTLEKQGGVGYNVVGELPGVGETDEKLVIAAHHDAYFRAGMDDTSGSTQALTIAKAMTAIGYRPQRTVVFFLTTAEEFGYIDAYYDFLVGSSYAMTHTHSDWPGTVAGMINLEAQGGREGRIRINASADLRPWIEGILEGNPELAIYGADVLGVSSWTDGFPFAAAGIPNVTFSASGADYQGRYHTNYDVQQLIDWQYFGTMAKLEFRLANELDRGLLPYGLAYQADDLAASVNEEELGALGADAEVTKRLMGALRRYRESARAYEKRKSTLASVRHAELNRALMKIQQILGSNLTTLGREVTAVYPHQPLLADTLNIQKALQAIQSSPVDPEAAREALADVSLTPVGLRFSEPVYRTEMSWIDPNYERIGFGRNGHVVSPIDVLPEFRQLEAGDAAGAITGLLEKKNAQIEELNARLAQMSEVIERVVPEIEALQ
ncbi:MAG: M28 family peptidase [Deltaproteobacteria bacterium]|jgi:Iap family predicted aminopeptidase|nr:M28 family peptidase [Deltaproteobacteria bacterium]